MRVLKGEEVGEITHENSAKGEAKEKGQELLMQGTGVRRFGPSNSPQPTNHPPGMHGRCPS